MTGSILNFQIGHKSVLKLLGKAFKFENLYWIG